MEFKYYIDLSTQVASGDLIIGNDYQVRGGDTNNTPHILYDSLNAYDSYIFRAGTSGTGVIYTSYYNAMCYSYDLWSEIELFNNNLVFRKKGM